MKEKHCVDCHFLVEDFKFNLSGMPDTKRESVTEEHRIVLRQNLFPADGKDWKIYCCRGSWKQKEYKFSVIKKDEEEHNKLNLELNVINRFQKCFFWEYDEQVPIDAAEKIEERQIRNIQFSQEWKLIKIGLWIAIIAIIISSVFNILNFLLK